MDRMLAPNHMRNDGRRVALSNDMRSRLLLLAKRKSASDRRFRQNLSDDVRSRLRALSMSESASAPSSWQSLLNDVRSRLRLLFTRKSASGPSPWQSLLNDALNRLRLLSTRKSASDPSPWQSPLNDVLSRLRLLSKHENAGTILLAVGLVAFFALTSYYGEYRGEPKTSVPACDSDLCGSPTISATIPNLPETATTRPAQKADEHRQPAPDAKGKTAGLVTSRKTGARAHVGAAYAARFQAYIDDLETNHGARVLFMGGIRPGKCSLAGLHPCGKALDVCQLRRGVVDPRCHLPPRQELAKIASSHGLFEGGRWCDSDYGHAQLVMTHDCRDRRTPVVRRHTAPEADRQAAVDQRFRPM